MENFAAVQCDCNRRVKNDRIFQTLPPEKLQSGMSASQFTALVTSDMVCGRSRDCRHRKQVLLGWLLSTPRKGRSISNFPQLVNRSNDPVELFLDSGIRFPKAHIARRLMQKKFGFRYLMDVIGLDASVVKGSHGRLAAPGREETDSPVFVCSSRAIEADAVAVTGVKKQLLQLQFGV